MEIENILYHGPGGTGKTFAIKELMVKYKERGLNIAATALTGIAAIGLNNPEKNIFATTVHSWSGIGIGTKSKEELLGRVCRFKKDAWNIDVLFIDEISMMNMELFEKLEWIARQIRENKDPFGGIQLVLSGDFLQLPPVEGQWVFESKRWEKLNLKIIKMEEGKRFKDDMWFDVLKRVRIGGCTEEDIKFIKSLVVTKETKINKEILPTLLFATNARANLYNAKKLNELKTPIHEFNAIDRRLYGRRCTVNQSAYLNAIIPSKLKFKVGAQVMLRVNLSVEDELVNGARGVILEITPKKINVKFRSITEWIGIHDWETEYYGTKIVRKQIPLILAWGQTIHKSQGATLDTVICSLGRTIFADAQAYIALSRVRIPSDIQLLEFKPCAIKVNKKALSYYNSM